MTFPSFSSAELSLIRYLLSNPSAFHLTELELRACSLVVTHSEGGSPVADDYVALVRHLLETVRATGGDDLAWLPQADRGTR